MRATDEMVRDALIWARNYEEIESYRLVATRGRKWEVKLPSALVLGAGFFRGRPQDEVPAVLVPTNREALAFAYGCAAGGERGPRQRKRDEWGWG